MFKVELKRILKAGIMNFWRNGLVSLAAIFIMVLALFMIGSLVFSNVLLTSSLERIESQVDVSVYFKPDVSEQEALSVKKSLEGLAQVKEVGYVSRAEALAKFRSRHSTNALITQSLDELDENPFGASLRISAKNPDQYGAIANFLNSDIYSGVIDKVNFFQNQVVIERLSNVLSASRATGLGITAVLAGIAVLVVFNTIRLAIYTSRDEISVMRLVGASNRFVRGPFLVSGILYGIISAFITMFAFYPLTLWLGPKASRFFGGPDLFIYYVENFLEILLVLLVAGVILGIISSTFAIRRYLKV